MTDKSINWTVLKIALLGDTAVGKTAICRALMNLDFLEEQISTIGSEKYDKKLVLNNNKEMKVVLWDTAGQERFKSIALGALRTAHGIILVFDVTKESSFENVNTWLEKIKEISANPCIVLFGNKADSPKEQWQVKLEEVKKFAESNKMKFFLTSAKTKEGLDDGLLHISNEAYANALKKINGNIQIDNNDEYEYVTGCFGKKKRIKKKKNKA